MGGTRKISICETISSCEDSIIVSIKIDAVSEESYPVALEMVQKNFNLMMDGLLQK